jgi:sulfur-carrier protein
MKEEGEDPDVRVTLFAWLRQLFEMREARVPAEDASDVGQLLSSICSTREQRQGLFQESGALRADLTVLLNGHNIALMSGGSTALRSGDEVAVFPAIYGG